MAASQARFRHTDRSSESSGSSMDQMQQMSEYVRDYPASTMLAAFGAGLVVGTVVALQFMQPEPTYQERFADASSTAFQRARDGLMSSVKSLQDAVSSRMS